MPEEGGGHVQLECCLHCGTLREAAAESEGHCVLSGGVARGGIDRVDEGDEGDEDDDEKTERPESRPLGEKRDGDE